MGIVTDFLRLVSAIHATTVTAERWDATLAELVKAFDGTGSRLGDRAADTGHGRDPGPQHRCRPFREE